MRLSWLGRRNLACTPHRGRVAGDRSQIGMRGLFWHLGSLLTIAQGGARTVIAGHELRPRQAEVAPIFFGFQYGGCAVQGCGLA
jgi:hypothetical protein